MLSLCTYYYYYISGKEATQTIRKRDLLARSGNGYDSWFCNDYISLWLLTLKTEYFSYIFWGDKERLLLCPILGLALHVGAVRWQSPLLSHHPAGHQPLMEKRKGQQRGQLLPISLLSNTLTCSTCQPHVTCSWKRHSKHPVNLKTWADSSQPPDLNCKHITMRQTLACLQMNQTEWCHGAVWSCCSSAPPHVWQTYFLRCHWLSWTLQRPHLAMLMGFKAGKRPLMVAALK